MTTVELYDALDCLSGFTKNPDGSIKSPFPSANESALAGLSDEMKNAVKDNYAGQVVTSINNLPETDRADLIGTWLYQRFHRDHQIEWVDNASIEHGKEALKTLASNGIEIPELAVK
jgi:hypothetical protein